MNRIQDYSKLDLGCGYNKPAGYITIDSRACCEPDYVIDIARDGLKLFEDSTIDEVRAWDFLEHIPIGSAMFVIGEIWSVLKPNGLFESMTPDCEQGQGHWQDPTHRTPWCENSWLYYSMPHLRKLYDIKAEFNIERIERIPLAGAHMPRVFHLHVLARAIK